MAGFGPSYFKKSGALNASGQKKLANKKPLIGESRALSTQIHPSVSGNTLTISSPLVYATIQQFDGQAGCGHKVTIPVRQDGSLYPTEQALVLDTLTLFLTQNP